MRDDKFTTSDFLATGERNEERERQAERDAEHDGGRVTTATGNGGAQMVREPAAPMGGAPAAPSASTPLFADAECQDFRSRWDRIQIAFVDDPRHAVEEADSLVASTMKRLAEIFSDERNKMEKQWDRGDDVSTEDLRLSLQRYRSFFNRLLMM